jgi:isocitrate dehydrogenase
MISVVVVYNNKHIFEEVLMRSLKDQTAEFELIALDNTRGEFKSASAALNYGGLRATGRYIMFVHQRDWREKTG